MAPIDRVSGGAEAAAGAGRRLRAACAGFRDRLEAAARDASWRRFGLIGFLFFLGKGLLWLLVPILLAVIG